MAPHHLIARPTRPASRPASRRGFRPAWAATVLAGTVAAGTLAAGATTATADDSAPGTSIGDGAVTLWDVGAATDGRPALEVVTENARHAPASVTVIVDGDRARDAASADVPEQYRSAFGAGATMLAVPPTVITGLPTLGWSASRIPPEAQDVTSSQVHLDLALAGPGDAIVLGDDQLPVIDSRDHEPDGLTVEPGSNGWLTWLFEGPGRYTVDATPTLVGADGSRTVGETARFVIEVSEPAPTTDPPPADPDADPDPAPPPVPAPAPPPADDPSPPAAPGSGPGGNRGSGGGVRASTCTLPGLAGDASTVSEGHLDFGVLIDDDNNLRSRIKDDRSDPPRWVAPNKRLFALGDAAAGAVPTGSTYSFLGDPGDPIWTMAQTQQAGVPWLGWNTQHPSAVDRIDGATTWHLDAVEGPGELFIYQTGSFGAVDRLLGLAGGWPRQLRIAPNTHAHANWSFTAPGSYRITTTHRATLRSGGRVSSTATLYFQVGACGDAEQPTRPLDAALLLKEGRLAAGNRGGVSVSPTTVTAGHPVAITVPGVAPGSWLMPVLYSTPRQLGWSQVTPTRELAAVGIPGRTAAGRHKLAVYDETGLVGWAPVRVVAAATPDDEGPPPDADTDEDPPPADDADQEPPPTPPTAPAGSTCVAPTGSESDDSDNEGDDGESDPGNQATVSDGHFDFGPTISGGELVAQVKDDRTSPPRWVAPESLRFALGSAAERDVPAGSTYSFLGQPGDKIWLMPQTEASGVPWLGWNTQHESVRAEARGSVRFALDAVSGPGELAVYLTDSFGGVGEKVFGNARGFPSSFTVPLNVHAHGNWAFTAAGTYQLTMTVSATLGDGSVASDQATLTFDVGVAANAAPSRTTSRATSPALMQVVAARSPRSVATTPVQETAKEEDSEEGADEDPAEDDEDTAASPDGCTLPDTGAPAGLGTLLPLGVALLVTGFGLLVARRRAAA